MSGRRARIPAELDLPSDLPISVASTDFDSELEPEDKMWKSTSITCLAYAMMYTNMPITTYKLLRKNKRKITTDGIVLRNIIS